MLKMKYIFFYDETEHSRKINYETVTANNYYDNFITGIVGWKAEDEFYVLSVGFSQNRTPLVTISENDKPICYRLPEDYGEWAMNVVGMANMGERLFPSKVVFSLIDGRYLVDIL